MSAASHSAGLESLDLPDPDESYDDLTLGDNNDPTEFVKPGKKDGLEKGFPSEVSPQYILGTLIIRVVAARDLQPVERGGLSQMVFGSNRPIRSSLHGSGGSANPYASVKFGNSTQRSSEVYDSLDPIWPRQETMFMDVSLPVEEMTHPDVTGNSTSGGEGTASRQSAEQTNSSYKYVKPSSTLTVAIFHTPEIGKLNKYPNKAGGYGYSGDSDDLFLGMASVDLSRLFTGRELTFDKWLPLSGAGKACGSVRIVCEYEPSDATPRPGDYCRFTRFCHPRDLYPLKPSQQYRVSEVNGDNVLISYTTQEGWVCSFQAHRYMLICEERHQNAVETAQDELASIAERLSHSPLVHSIAETAERVAVDGLLNVGEDIVRGGFSLFNRWFDGGVDTIVGDVVQVTNWDGRFNPNASERLDVPDLDPVSDDSDQKMPATTKSSTALEEEGTSTALPNMPSCPITGEPMIDPVVAADGHTYERTAIARWLTTSDKSPLTGAILSHKELVPNYGLVSSVQEAASRAAAAKPAATATTTTTVSSSSSSLETNEQVDIIPGTAATLDNKQEDI